MKTGKTGKTRKTSALILTFFAIGNTYAKAPPYPVLDWNSSESRARLARSQHLADFYELTNHFESQENAFTCALAASTIVLNALRLRKKKDLPKDQSSIKPNERKYIPAGFDPFFKKYTQDRLLNHRTKSKMTIFGKPTEIKGKMTKDFGIQLAELANLLKVHGLKVTKVVVQKGSDTQALKKEIIENLKRPNDYVLVNYARKSFGQKGGGHVSPLGAYDRKTDTFLIMDVNTHKAPWIWVKGDHLVEAMRTYDMVENRGYLLISDR